MEHDNDWRERAHALARTQANYVWILLVTGIFYFSLPSGNSSFDQSQGVREYPFAGVLLNGYQILLSAPFVLSFLILAFSGAVRAFNRASEKTLPEDYDETWAAERLDVFPNAIDMVVYHTEETPRWIVTLGYFGYPLYLSVFLLEAIWLWGISLCVASNVAQFAVSMASVLVLGPACWQVVGAWRRRWWIVQAGRHHKGTGDDASV